MTGPFRTGEEAGDAPIQDVVAHEIDRLQWIAACVGALLFAGVLAMLVYFELASDGSPPRLMVEMEEASPVPGGFALRFSVLNEGGTTAAELEVQGELRDGESVVETGSVTFDYVPPGSSRQATLVFTRDPARHAVVLRPLGFREP